MMRILSWNLQTGISAAGQAVIPQQCRWLRQANADLLALQEVDLPLLAALRQSLPEYYWHFAAGRSGWLDGYHQALGNAIGTRLPFGSVEARVLPQVATQARQHMARSALRLAVASTPPLTLICTHLEYHCADQRRAQLLDLQRWQREAIGLQAYASQATHGFYQAAAWPEATLLCGDLNLPHGGDEHGWLLRQGWHEATTVHPPLTCGLFDTRQWPQGPHCRDFMLANAALRPRLGRLWADEQVDMSDHQPLFLELQ